MRQLLEQRTYPLETNLVAHFVRCLRRGDTPWGRVRIAFEFDYVGGYADVLVLAGGQELVAFEAKLQRWREALHQAYRTLCFASRSYVVLPSAAAEVAVQHEQEFRRRRVGICSMSAERGLEVLVHSDVRPPLQPWIAERAICQLAPRKGARKACQRT